MKENKSNREPESCLIRVVTLGRNMTHWSHGTPYDQDYDRNLIISYP